MTTAAPEQFEQPWLLLCEGVGDQRFFAALFDAHSFGSNFHVRVPYREGKYGGGRANFGADLGNIAISQSFIDKVRAVLVVSDNDDLATSFTEVQDQLRACKFPIPAAERQVAKAKGFPDVVVLMLPISRQGNLESLCLESAYNKWPLKADLDMFVSKVPAKDWTVGKQAKMRMQTMLAATNSSQPDAGFAAHWRQDTKFRIPLDHACFGSLVTFLKTEFPSLVAA